MIDFGYDIWFNVCKNVLTYASVYGKYYVQLYPFVKKEFFDFVSTEKFYNTFIKSGAIFEKSNLIFPENLCIKSDGTLRERYLLSPIIYLYYIAIGEFIYNKNKTISNEKIVRFYAGDFSNNNYHYKNSYNSYMNLLQSLAHQYSFYIKFDISSFYKNINLNILCEMLLKKNIFTEAEATFFKNFLSICGNNCMPQTECGITSSYLSTIFYLEETDYDFISFLNEYECFSDFMVVRYVDDLFIFFKPKTIFANNVKIENDLSNYLNEKYHKLGLCLNKQKTKIKKSNKIFEDIKSFSLFDENTLDEDIDDLVSKNIITNFLKKLIKCVNKNGISYSQYQNIINECFKSKKTKYHASQIYSTLVYKKSRWISATETRDELKKALETDYNILIHDPKLLTTLIMNTEDTILIKKLLDKLFRIYRNNEWNVVCTYIALIYLLNSDFRHIDLLKIIEEQDSILHTYICNYCKSNWFYKCLSLANMKFVSKAYLNKSNLYYLLFMYNFELKNSNILHAYSYFKNYFDVITAHFAFLQNSKNKFSVESYYQEKNLKKFYIDNMPQMKQFIDDTLSDTAKFRNGNPVCHGSGKILTYHDYSEKLWSNILALQRIINAYIGNNL